MPSVEEIKQNQDNNERETVKNIKQTLEKIPFVKFSNGKNNKDFKKSYDIKDISYARPEAISRMFYKDQESMKRHLDIFITDENFEDKWGEILEHIKNSDHPDEKIKQFKNKFREVF